MVAKLDAFSPEGRGGTILPPRECFFVVYSDGEVDQVAVSDVSWPGDWSGGYEIVGYAGEEEQ